ncbi:hypothetical protein BEP19_15980 [Ammoniphilus oxalaticus]|uniref:Uncharacterized protein n=1 Tax=Ammoniphilus oxalaticus TaxID=66863 RepID=A0A419SQF4_9BACL|nr:hypothetical protein [Ammoniphilus oxalaticus]RKD26703.1 hypothetical protein BEP19_15980 [Ammoniphilus oxalaticus]
MNRLATAVSSMLKVAALRISRFLKAFSNVAETVAKEAAKIFKKRKLEEKHVMKIHHRKKKSQQRNWKKWKKRRRW